MRDGHTQDNQQRDTNPSSRVNMKHLEDYALCILSYKDKLGKI